MFFITILSHPARNTKDINPVNEEGDTYPALCAPAQRHWYKMILIRTAR